jgi:glucose-1-phosphate thymidylyltransferase
LIDHGYRVESHLVTGWWKDTGNLEAMLEANRLILDTLETRIEGDIDEESEVAGRVSIGKGTKIIQSSIRGPAIIGENCHIENAFIGPYTSINNGVTIVASEVEHSIILENCTILNIGSRLEDSLLGKNVRIERNGRKPRAYRMMLGDNSAVGVI